MSTPVLAEAAALWALDLQRACTTRDVDTFRTLFGDQVSLRDNGALTFDLRQFHGREAVVSMLLTAVDHVRPGGFTVSSSWPEPQMIGLGEDAKVEIFLDFETRSGRAVAFVSAVPDTTSIYGFVVQAVFTRLEELNSVTPPPVHPRGNGFTPEYSGQVFGEHDRRRRNWETGNPEVLIVGGGQAGLMAAAHLDKIGVTALIVDQNERVGDNWRLRYDALCLHNSVDINEFPFLAYPSHYPEFFPKDVMGDWLDIYASYLGLNVWTSTEFLDATFDDEAGVWSARVRQAGDERMLHPRHIVLATGGIGGRPAIPALPGLESFTGRVIHSSAYTTAAEFDVKQALVVGSATSAHDIALDLHDHGAEVTMVQRGPVVVNQVETGNLAYTAHLDPEISSELATIRSGMMYVRPVREATYRQYHAFAKALDADLIRGLEEAGMQVGDGFEGQGWPDLFMRTGGGFYLNKGASDVIIQGGIKILPYDRIREFSADGALLNDGSSVDADLVVLATGYQNRKVEIADQFGPEVADRVGEIARWDDEGEWSAMWGQTGQRGLWINGGAIIHARPGSRILALLIKADLDGHITEPLRRRPDNASTPATS